MNTKETYYLAEYTSWGGPETYFVNKNQFGDEERWTTKDIALEALEKMWRGNRGNTPNQQYRLKKVTHIEEIIPVNFVSREIQGELLLQD